MYIHETTSKPRLTVEAQSLYDHKCWRYIKHKLIQHLRSDCAFKHLAANYIHSYKGSLRNYSISLITSSEPSGSVVECSTRDGVIFGSSLAGNLVLCT